MKDNQFLLLFILFSFYGYISVISIYEKNPTKNFVQNDSLSSITLAFVGDLMCHTPQIKSSIDTNGQYNFNSTFEYVRDFISSADLAFGNLETTIGDSVDRFTGYPRFRSPEKYLDGLVYAGFDFLFLANNHILDYGEKGILKTINHLKQRGIGYTGAFESYKDFDSLRIIEMNKIKLGLIAATFSTNGIPVPSGKKYLVNLINFDSLKSQIHKLRNSGADIIILNLHFGDEYSTEPNKYQLQVVDSLINFGADIIIGNHPHVLQPVEIRRAVNSKIDSVMIAYSLGNFISNQRKLLTASGAILFITIEKKFTTDEIKLKQIKILPTYVYKGRINKKLQYKIIPLTQEHFISDSLFADHTNQKNFQSAYELAKKILLKNMNSQSSIVIENYSMSINE